ncbi:arsenite-activated ATPase ArsA [Oscillochloris trichoides DG-6]|uniref:arsenite-transporting ATPase n=1 Tax=Oscillochloris trichoides DG-6 TaxID=765420 RepID=E1IAP4_9CHLR|nr:TRC40/GET3/ArsA family transport-energizing ATPase [Oscillochloris trichoides]EFO81723.1 arsenite-activated ATPase ArsA [Oscillochloris trichoides DG-6]
MRLILYLGKGGVGKTTTAAATAVRAAEMGYRTLVVSTDVAHSLADALDAPLGALPTKLTDKLWGQEINVLEEVREHWGQLRVYLSTLLRRRGVDEVAAEELAIIPGMEEVVSLLHIRRQAKEGEFDVVVVDAAPTGETVRLLTMPETFQWYAARVMDWEPGTLKVARPLVKALIPATDMFETIERLTKGVEALRSTLTDPQVSSYRLVVNPERMVIKEAQRAATYLSLFGYPVDGVVLNRVLPMDAAEGAFMKELARIQQGYRQQVYDIFQPLPIWEGPHYARDLAGIKDLSEVGNRLFGDTDPTKVQFTGKMQEISREGDDYIMKLPLPHVEIGKVQMVKRGDELFIEIGNFRRDMILPMALAERPATKALFRNGVLEVRFGPAEGLALE